MNKILALWAVPRSTSTAFEWMMRQRGDMTCYHEPFGEVWYYGHERRVPRPNPTPPIDDLSFQGVLDDILEKAADGSVFVKEFSHYIIHMADRAFLDLFTHTFLIRDPAKMIPSMFDKWPDFHIAETGYQEQYVLFDRICERDGKAPPVIDAEELLDNPFGVAKAYCEAIGIPFIESALNWDAGDRKEVSWYEGGSWHENLRESTGLVRQKRTYLPIDANEKLQTTYTACKPHYDVLYKHRLQPDSIAAAS